MLYSTDIKFIAMNHQLPRRPRRIKNRKSITDRMAHWAWLCISTTGNIVVNEVKSVTSVAKLNKRAHKQVAENISLSSVESNGSSHVLDLRDPETQADTKNTATTETSKPHVHVQFPKNKTTQEVAKNAQTKEAKSSATKTSLATVIKTTYSKLFLQSSVVLLRQAHVCVRSISKCNFTVNTPQPTLPSLAFVAAPMAHIAKLATDAKTYISQSVQKEIITTGAQENPRVPKQNNIVVPSRNANIKAMIKKYLPKKRNKNNSRQQSFWLWRWLKNIILGGFVIGFVAMGIFFIWVATLEIPASNIDDVLGSQSTKIYDATGEVLLYDVFKDEKRTTVTLDKISPNMQKAILATEDDEFYSHGGYDVSAILRGVCYEISRVVQMDTFGGVCPRGGGSTITQQVIKNTLLNADRKIERKVKEVVLARKLEKQKTKDQILEIYLNEIAFGGPIYGVEQASLNMFGKKAIDLSIAESAYLAALPKAPTTYLNNRARFDGRQQFILGRMRSLGYITESQYQQAASEDVVFTERVDKGIKAPHFVFYVLEQLDQKLSTEEEALNLGGYQIQTTLDWELQQELEEIVATESERLGTQYGASNLAVVAIENSTGKIKAMVGSKDYFAEDIDGKFNIATALRQPGSTFKPFVYASAFAKGYTPETILWDTPTEFSTSCYPDGTPQLPQYKDRCYSPQNYDKTYRGPMTIRGALAGSLNIPAVKALYLTGISDAMALARDLGISSLTRSPNFYGLNLVLGGGEVQLLEMVNAYSTFANNGKRHQIAAWESVVDQSGEIVDEFTEEEEQVLSANVAAMINDILSDDNAKRPVFGQSSRLYYGNTPVAVKTGTTNNFRDVWTIGYSSDITVGVWAGNNDNTPMSRAPSSSVVGPVWRSAMDAALKTYGAKPFPNYSLGDTSSWPSVLLGNYEQGGVTYIDPETGETIPNPTEEEIEAGIYQRIGRSVYHSILHLVNKSNPQNGTPNPGADSLYENFEYGVETWTQAQGWVTEFSSSTINELIDLIDEAQGNTDDNDDPQPKEDEPFGFSITSPQPGLITSSDEKIFITISLTGDATEAETIYYYVNNSYIESGNYRKNSVRVNLDSIRDLKQTNTVKVIIEKTDGSRVEKTASFTIN